MQVCLTCFARPADLQTHGDVHQNSKRSSTLQGPGVILCGLHRLGALPTIGTDGFGSTFGQCVRRTARAREFEKVKVLSRLHEGAAGAPAIGEE